ncbi:hypothetical protein LEP1GSC202_2504 [Leptospira yanagawae serovar Saopaulo str. Sao Paulo = ATCC 700523]|uniref:Uncharacterized protein n=1 Tax=Leptospira yanagawae serovar Saopaulo str. Sao Paulo = ATCC 700523 TaxID=1249483 RepID=A0A5E8H9T9_9LEPT|nr:hypothetical protein LEP1GSC202_2504 [Leptospira yanagawae serovar Saopaulo str. Sao Paulo = ATCC 700523]
MGNEFHKTNIVSFLTNAISFFQKNGIFFILKTKKGNFLLVLNVSI